MSVRLLAALLLLLPGLAGAQAYRAGVTSGTWLSDSSIATGGTLASTSGTVPYNTHRWGAFTLNVPASGAVSVRLHFQEHWANPGQRVFHVELEGQRVETSLDVAAVAGRNPLIRTYTANVTDGTLTARFVDGGPDDPMYSAIEVTASGPAPPDPPVVTGDAVLNWTAPARNVDGTSLTDLTGFSIYRGTSAGALSLATTVGPSVLTYTFANLAAGTYYFAIGAANSRGEEGRSQAVSRTISTAPQPVDCVVSAFGAWTSNNDWSPLTCPASGIQTGTETRTRTVVTPAANGGAACPALTETRSTTRTCSAPSTWRVAPTSATTRPVYEAVLNAAGSVLVRGNAEGTVPVGTTCGAEVFKISTNSYREIPESSAQLASPTYRGRRHVALCVSQ
jgi:hypothetical protein